MAGPTGSFIRESSPAVVAGIVYIGSQDGSLYAFDDTTGAKLWSAATGYLIDSSPAVQDGRVFITSQDGSAYAFDAMTGAKLWQQPLGGVASPTVAGGHVFIPSGSVMYALDPASGATLWSAPTRGLIHAAATVARGRVLVSAENGFVYALDQATGRHLWKADVGDLQVSSPVVDDDRVFVGTMDGDLAILDVETGEVLWHVHVHGNLDSTPVVAYGRVFFTEPFPNRTWAFKEANGELLWKVPGGGGTFASAALANGVLYTGAADGHVYALDAITRHVLWISPDIGGVPGEVSSPVVVNGAVYVGSDDFSLHKFSLPGGG